MMGFLIRPISFLFVLFFSYFLKRLGVFRKEHSMIVMKIILNITLPAVAVSAFADFNRDYSLLFLVLIGLGASVGCYFLMFAITRNMEKGKRSFFLISASAYNVGCYGLPVIQAFYGSIGTIVAILFDCGNTIMMASGNYALTSTLLRTEGEETRFRIRDLLKIFFSSVTVDVYLVLLVLGLFGIIIPQSVVTFIDPIAAANPFLAMFMLGLLFTLPRQRSDWKNMLLVLAYRIGVSGGLAALLFFVLPFSLEIRQILILLLLCPIGSVSPGFVEKCHGDGELASFTNSVTTIASLIIMSVLAGWVFV